MIRNSEQSADDAQTVDDAQTLEVPVRVLDLAGDSEDLDALLDALRDERRRRVLRRLDSGTPPVDLSDLAREVVRSERGVDSRADLPSDAVDRTSASLHHVHLPKLDDAGVVDYDPDDNTVRLDDDLPGYDSNPDLDRGLT